MSAVGARGRSQLLAARGDVPAAAGAAERAMTHHANLPMPFETARTQLLLGQLYRRSRQRSSAATILSAATTAFEELGAPLWATRARAELTRTTAVHGDGRHLTAAERRVADCAATGLSNKDIAAELFLSAKTVEATLTRVYRKLGVRSRTGLVTALTERP
jgi:DNA-binding CsgD family transcriptional regulator